MDVKMNVCYTCPYYKMKDFYCEKYLRGKESAVFLCPECKNTDDLISRQAAIDFIAAGHLCNPNEPRWSDNEVVNFLKSRPSAQPEITSDQVKEFCKEMH